MLQRAPNRVELKPEDKEEYDNLKKAAQQKAAQQQQQQPDTYNLGNIGVEIKIKLPDQDALNTLAGVLAPNHKAHYEQENYFFDGVEGELSSKHAVLRVRFYNKDEKAVITLKGKQVLKDGIGRATEVEEAVDPAAARSFLEHPEQLLELESNLMRDAKSAYSIKGLKHLGGFLNTREVFAWEGHQLELDCTSYPWGTTWEVECETDKPEELRTKLEALLVDVGIAYKYSTTTKFANFIHQKLD